jgi:hypothetical protein
MFIRRHVCLTSTKVLSYVYSVRVGPSFTLGYCTRAREYNYWEVGSGELGSADRRFLHRTEVRMYGSTKVLKRTKVRKYFRTNVSGYTELYTCSPTIVRKYLRTVQYT